MWESRAGYAGNKWRPMTYVGKAPNGVRFDRWFAQNMDTYLGSGDGNDDHDAPDDAGEDEDEDDEEEEDVDEEEEEDVDNDVDDE